MLPSSRRVTRTPYAGSATRNGLSVRRANCLNPPARLVRVEQSGARTLHHVHLQDDFVRRRENGVKLRRGQPRRQGGYRQRNRLVETGADTRQKLRVGRQSCDAAIMIDLEPGDRRSDLPPLREQAVKIAEQLVVVVLCELAVDPHDRDHRPAATLECVPIDGYRLQMAAFIRICGEDTPRIEQGRPIVSMRARRAGVHLRCQM